MAAVDKVEDRIAVRFTVDDDEETESGYAAVRQETWVYDGSWSELSDLRDTRTTFQPGGRLVWRHVDEARGAEEYGEITLTWVPDRGDEEAILGPDRPCPSAEELDGDRGGDVLCPLISAPGSLLPPE